MDRSEKSSFSSKNLHEFGKESIESVLIALKQQLELITECMNHSENNSESSALQEQAKDLVTLSHLFLGLLNKDLITRRTEIQQALQAPSSSAAAQHTEQKTHRVLLVEDHPLAADIAKAILSDLDCEVDIAENANEAIEQSQKSQYDLIFMDIGLPDMDGYETTKIIHSHESKDHHVPIVALTAHADKYERERCLKSGMDAILIKPLFKEKAVNILNMFIPKMSDFTFDAANDEINDSALPDEIIDLELGARFFQGNTKLAHKMISTMIANFYAEYTDFNEAFESKDWEELQNLIRKFRGAIAYCGTPRLEAACRYLENYLKAGHQKFAPPLYEQLVREVGNVKTYLEENV